MPMVMYRRMSEINEVFQSSWASCQCGGRSRFSAGLSVIWEFSGTFLGSAGQTANVDGGITRGCVSLQERQKVELMILCSAERIFWSLFPVSGRAARDPQSDAERGFTSASFRKWSGSASLTSPSGLIFRERSPCKTWRLQSHEDIRVFTLPDSTLKPQ